MGAHQSFNHIESMYELAITPHELRQAADLLERQSKEGYLEGQIIRYKLSHNFCLVHKPERSFANAAIETSPT